MPAAAPLPSDFLTLQEVATRLNVSIRYVRGLRQSGALPVVPLSSRAIRVRPEDLDQFVAERMARGARRARR
jgi:excisionase family DNA binding protein